MVRPCSENGRRKITQNSIAVDAETKESMRKTKNIWMGRPLTKETERKASGKIGSNGV
jgi:hypothetical protein